MHNDLRLNFLDLKKDVFSWFDADIPSRIQRTGKKVRSIKLRHWVLVTTWSEIRS